MGNFIKSGEDISGYSKSVSSGVTGAKIPLLAAIASTSSLKSTVAGVTGARLTNDAISVVNSSNVASVGVTGTKFWNITASLKSKASLKVASFWVLEVMETAP
jgi:hypothetical protein